MNDDNIPPDADQPITVYELHDFLHLFVSESHVFIEINGKHFPIKEMSNNNGNLCLAIDYKL